MPSKHCKQFVDLDENSILSPDKEKQANYLSTLVTNGILTINESREVLGFNKVEGGDKNLVLYSDVNQNNINQNEDKNNVEQENEQES